MATVTVTAPGTDTDTWTDLVRIFTAICGRAQGGGSWTRDDEARRITAQLDLSDEQAGQVEHDFLGFRMTYSEITLDFAPDA